MVKKTKEEALETRNNVLKAALKLFYEKGYQETSINDIAKAMGTTRGAVYWYFGCKGDILKALWSERIVHVNRILHNVRNISSVGENDIDNIRAVLENFLGSLFSTTNQDIENKMFFHIIHILMISGNSEEILYIREQTKIFDREIFSVIYNLILKIKNNSQTDCCIEIKEIVTYLHLMLDGYFLNSINLVGFEHEFYEKVYPHKLVDFIIKIIFKFI